MPDQIRVQVAVDTDDLRRWAAWHADRGHTGVAHVLYGAAERYEDQASALDRVRAELDQHPVKGCTLRNRIRAALDGDQ